MIPAWLHVLSIASLLLGALCLLFILADIVRHPQHLGIMNVVWPVTALFGSVWIVWQYVRYGRLAATMWRAGACRRRARSRPGRW